MSNKGGIRRILLFGGRLTSTAALVAAVVATSSCGTTQSQPQPRLTIRIMAGAVGGGFRSLIAELVRVYAQAFPNINFVLVEHTAAMSDVEQIQRGEADVGVALADAAHRAFVGQTRPELAFTHLRAIFALDVTPLHLIVRADSNIRGPADLPGHSVNLPDDRDTAKLTELVLSAFGVDIQSIRAERYSPATAVAKLVSGDLDAMLYPMAYPAESIMSATKAGGRLLPIDGKPIQRLLQDHTFLQLARIPGGIYPNIADSIRTIGVAAVWLCRSDLDEDVVYQMTRQFFEIVPGASASLGPLRFMDLEHAPATPIPLHDGAARYYRERTLLR
jgi:TRAP transporter TAXI family solute receptor